MYLRNQQQKCLNRKSIKDSKYGWIFGNWTFIIHHWIARLERSQWSLEHRIIRECILLGEFACLLLLFVFLQISIFSIYELKKTKNTKGRKKIIRPCSWIVLLLGQKLRRRSVRRHSCFSINRCFFIHQTFYRINSETFKQLIDIGDKKGGDNSAEFAHTLGSNFYSLHFNGVTIKWDQKAFRIYVTLDSKWIGKVCSTIFLAV